MPVYVRKFGSRIYFMGFRDPLMPTLGLPDFALPFESSQSAFDCLPAVLHFDMEVVNEDCRRTDAEAWRLQNAAGEWPIEPSHSPSF
jgi:hypothetical protein